MDQFPSATQSAKYRIRIAGRVRDDWADFMRDVDESCEQENGATVTTISGVVTDQAALHGLLEHIRDLNLTLLSVVCQCSSTLDLKPESKETK